MEVLVGRVYRHFKGDLYLIEGIAVDSETKVKMVVYRALYGDFTLYVRPYDMFIEKTDKNKYPLATQEYRFQLVEIESKANKFLGK